ncbi:NmrA family NAD(P)-binding protein [Catenulispora sp. NF23]|uniref:NmrA family NAD(P)-binding protein n=1 Tax=Catenulispora pinistramenti TaxID=2705254 RepID=A0ABS5KMH6_9ACTN|nr:NmrA family NAD(P)-binding protein [Catenulispora pinistramenti]MBS2537665.1 NmrA family NAD(P)-binding protein [Catenulispora pinistramenti]MBS2547232.1 NmrA family NAD(P)-binding protein [Catenulispora pinistramenti]
MTDVKTTQPILVTGATGTVGGEVVAALRAAGAQVRALVRNDAQADAFKAAGVEPVRGDLNEPASLAGALTGAQALFLLPGYSDMPGVLNQARQAGVGHVVQLSGVSAASGHTDNAITAYMAASEQAVTESGLSHTIVRPSAFMANALRWADQLRAGDTVRAQFPDVAAAVLDPADLGAVAAAALLDPERHGGRVLLPTGPEALRPAQQIAILATALNRDLRCEPLSDEQTRAQMVADGTPEKYIEAFFDFYVAGAIDESPVRPVVAEVTGRPPRTFSDWATAHSAEFGPRRTPDR